jgi:hypothetical protein
MMVHLSIIFGWIAFANFNTTFDELFLQPRQILHDLFGSSALLCEVID